MRLFNWRRQAILHAMPVVKPDQIRTPWREFWRRFRRQHVALVAGGFVLALILVAIFARWLTPYDAENYFDYDSLNNGPSLQHWFALTRWEETSLAGFSLGRRSHWRRACSRYLSAR